MVIHINDMYDILSSINSTTCNTVFLDIKLSTNLNLVSASIVLYESEDSPILMFSESINNLDKTGYSSNDLRNILIAITNNDNIHSLVVFDLKYLLKGTYCNPLETEGQIDRLLSKVIDLQYFIYMKFGEDLLLDSKRILDWLGTKKGHGSIVSNFMFERSKLKRKAWEIIPSYQLTSIVSDNMKAMITIHNRIVKTNLIEKSTHYKITMQWATRMAIIETAGMKFHKSMLPRLKNNFVKTETEMTFDHFIGYPEYYYTRSHTGRLTSSFNAMRKTDRAMMIPLSNETEIIEKDLLCFEVKTFASYFNIECDIYDIYEHINFGCQQQGYKKSTRDLVKTEIIKWMYGASKYNVFIVGHLPFISQAKIEIEQFKREQAENISNCFIETRYGARIYYPTPEEASRKCINGLIQNTAQMYIMELISSIYDSSLVFDSRTPDFFILATVYDSIIFDVVSNSIPEFESSWSSNLDKLGIRYGMKLIE